MAQKQQQHDHREQCADEHRVANRCHGVANEGGLIVHGFQMHARRKCRPERCNQLRDTVRNCDTVAANLSRDVKQRGRLAVTGNDANVIFRTGNDGREITDPRIRRNQDVRNILGRVGLLRGNNEVLLVVLRDTTNGSDGDVFANGFGEIVVGEAGG